MNAAHLAVEPPLARAPGWHDSLLYRWLSLLQCPHCCGHFVIYGHGEQRRLHCAKCAQQYALVHGIPRLLQTERAARIEKFCAQYDQLRLREGWASTAHDYYQNLPFEDRTGTHAPEWRLRARTLRQVQTWLTKNFGNRTLRILDAGAGSGWLSRVLAAQHEVVATDVNAGPHGLHALARAHRDFFAVQAELERLPFIAHGFDLVLANASAHYAEDAQQFFAEAARVLRPGGHLLVLDSPVYRDHAAVTAAHARTHAYYANQGVPELAQHYGGLARDVFIAQPAFAFSCLRRDFTHTAPLKKWLHEKLGGAAAARFPIWCGTRLPLPQDRWRPDRARAGALLIHKRKLLTYFFSGARGRYWRIPGGGVEAGETPAQAAVRELREELHLSITLQHGFGPYHLGHRDQWYFFAEADAAHLPAENTGGVEEDCVVHWLPLERLAQFDIRPAALKWELVEYFHAQSNA